MIEALEWIDTDFPWMLPTFIFILGLIVGSFLNVCIYRIPAERSVVFPGSTCACGAPISWYNNIPIISWCLLRGRAACCGARFSARYLGVELLTGLLFAVCWMQHPPIVALIGMLFIAFLICATFIDLDHMIIPDRFSIGGMILGVILSFIFPQLHSVSGIIPLTERIESGVMAIIGAVVGAGLVYWISVVGELVFRKPAMGEGDVKFVGFIGAFCGWQGAVFAMFGGAFVGTVVLLPLLLIQRLFGNAGHKRSDGEFTPDDDAKDEVEIDCSPLGQVPFGPMLAVAGLIYFLGFGRYVDAYLAEFAQLLGAN